MELTGYPGTPKLDTLRRQRGAFRRRPTGGFASSKPILNQIQQNIVWGIQDNLHSIPTDCNQRDERMGWMADAHLYAETAMLNFDMPAFYTNFLRDIHDVPGRRWQRSRHGPARLRAAGRRTRRGASRIR